MLEVKGKYGIIGTVDNNGAWLVWGKEKNGKTTFAIDLAAQLSLYNRVLYISAEEGFSSNISGIVKNVLKQTPNSKFRIAEYLSIEELSAELSGRRAPNIVFIDNLTVYNDEFKNGRLRDLLIEHKNKLFIFLAHEDRGLPYTSSAKMVSRLAKLIIYIEGMTAFVGGRTSAKKITIDAEFAQLRHGADVIQGE